MSAESIAAENQALAQTAAANAAASNDLLLQLIASIVNQASRKIPLDKWNSAALASPGKVDPGLTFEFTGAYADPGAAGTRPDLGTVFEAAFQRADAASRAMVDSAMAQFVKVYFPGLSTATTQLDALLLENAAGLAISADDRQTLAIEIENEIDTLRRAAQQTVMAGGGNGFDIPQPVRLAMLNNAEIAANDAVAESRTKTASTVIQLSVQIKQSATATLASIQQGMRSALLQYGGTIAGLRDLMVRYGTASADSQAKGYELSIEEYNGRRQAAQMAFESSIKGITTKMDLEKTGIEKKLETKRLELENLRLQLAVATVPYQAKLQTEIKRADLEISAMNQALHAQSEASHAMSSIAQAFASASQATSSVSKQE